MFCVCSTLIYSFYVLCSCFAPVLVCAPIIIIIIIIMYSKHVWSGKEQCFTLLLCPDPFFVLILYLVVHYHSHINLLLYLCSYENVFHWYHSMKEAILSNGPVV